MKKLVGRTDIEDALGRLDRLTQDEVGMAATQGLKATHGVDDKIDIVINGVQLAQSVSMSLNSCRLGGEKIREEIKQVANDQKR